MQPLAIQQPSSPTDASDAGSAGTPQSNSAGAVVFNELMTAARITANERRASDDEMAFRRAADQLKRAEEDRDTENAVAALSAAAQFAANKVRLKQRAAAEQLNHEDAARRAAEEKATAQQSIRTDASTPENKPSATDSAASREISADQAAPEKSSPSSSLQNEPTAAQTRDIAEPGAANSLTDQTTTAPASDVTTQAEQDGNLGATINGPTNTNTASSLSLTDQSSKTILADQAPSSPEEMSNAATKGAPSTDKVELKSRLLQSSVQQTLAAEPVSIAQPNNGDKAATPLPRKQADDDAQVDLDHSAANEDDESAPPVAPTPHVEQSNDTSAIAALVATPEVKNSNTAPIKTDTVLAPPRAQNGDQAIFKDKGLSAKTPAHQLAPTTADRAAMAVPEQDGRRPFTTEELEIRSVNKFDTDASTSGPDTSITLTADMEQTGSTQDEGRSQLQKANDQALTAIVKPSTLRESDLRDVMNPKKAETVSLAELEKLGVKAVSYHVEQLPTTPAAAPAPEPLAPSPAPSPTQVQVNASMTPNSAANTERRTIAADIRLRALERMVVAAAQAGTETLTLQLYPPALGQVMIRLVMDGQRLRIVTRAANAEAVNTLKNMEGDIRDALTSHGLDLADFDVSDESQQDDHAQRQQTAAPERQTTNGKKNETFIVDLNA